MYGLHIKGQLCESKTCQLLEIYSIAGILVIQMLITTARAGANLTRCSFPGRTHNPQVVQKVSMGAGDAAFTLCSDHVSGILNHDGRVSIKNQERRLSMTTAYKFKARATIQENRE